MTGRSIARHLASIVFVFAVSVALVGCGGGGGGNAKVTKDNFEKIQTGDKGMTEAQVKEILGEPSDTNTPPNQPNMKGLTWKNGNNMINVVFKDGKAEMKTSQFVSVK